METVSQQVQERPAEDFLTTPNLILLASSSSTLAERRRLPSSPEKLKLYSQIKNNNQTTLQPEVLQRLQEENAKLPTQDSEEFMLAHLERQNALLNADPKSICIESNRLQADFTTLRNLVTDATFSPTSNKNYEDTIQAMLTKTPLKPSDITDFEPDWDFWQTIVQDFSTAVKKLPHLLAAKLRCGGIPHRIRGVIWQAMSQSSSLNLESLYSALCQNESSYERVIQRDLSRTFPQLEMFKDDGGEGQLAMGRVLKAYSLYDAHVGYCQGLAFLVGPLLMTVKLMETYEMRTMFTLNMEGLHLRLFQFQTLLSQLCPRLDAHLTKHSIHTAMYASQWYLTLFAYSFPISLVLRIYDLVFAEGAVETITRVAVAMMQKNQDVLLEMDDFEQLMMYLSSRKLYQDAYESDAEAVIRDTMALSTVITKQKMDNIAESYHQDIEQEKIRAQQVLAMKFDSSNNNKKRESWFSWKQQEEKVEKQDRTIPILHEQIEDLVTELSRLQKENLTISEALMVKQMREIELLTERDQLLQRNTNLETKFVQHQPSPVESVDGDIEDDKKLELIQQKQVEFKGFVDSLKLSGEFGTLIAGALEPVTKPIEPVATTTVVVVSEDDKKESFDDVTSELVSIKLANFEMGLKYQSLCQEHEQLKRTLGTSNQDQLSLVNKIVGLQGKIESLELDKEQLIQERDELLDENDELEQKTLATKKTCADLQLEKLELDNNCLDLNKKVKQLEEQRSEYLMPRGSFTEEVLAAHQTLFCQAPAMNRRHTLQTLPTLNDEYQTKYIESDLRCRELEKLLAETKYRLVEYETAGSTASTSPRGSLQQNRRPNSGIHTKRSSLSMLVKVNANTSNGPHSPPYTDSRESTDSTRSTTSTSSGLQQKRSSVYSRFLNALGTGPLTEEAQELTEESK
ncbi:rab-GTPase-TBC domain-containing protein [Thamnidium elegans]|nr:rab-GTPase-TBC domain-containing protein [Thamnidium elegans]